LLQRPSHGHRYLVCKFVILVIFNGEAVPGELIKIVHRGVDVKLGAGLGSLAIIFFMASTWRS
jgi:DNA-directed RNA polymerase subunit E'/Rpb7